MISSAELSKRCGEDGEFVLAARHWSGGLRLEVGAAVIGVTVDDGTVLEGAPESGSGVIVLTATDDVWAAMTQPVPPPYLHDITSALGAGLTRTGDELTWWQYSPAAQRAIELLGPMAVTNKLSEIETATVSETGTDSGIGIGIGGKARFDSPTGRYVHLRLPTAGSDQDSDAADHRIYFEEAGSGIPLLLQHTAGAHGSQWRHLFENSAITDRFRLIAYDLPFHGKSLPPPASSWWAEKYQLSSGFLRAVPLALAAALDLDRPVFMGCSVGGLLALDLAANHPEAFRAVISLEGALYIGGDPDRLSGFWHPKVGGETKARMMQGLTAPGSPVAYRKETVFTYASGWPPAFLGDLHYYMVDYDLRDRADLIDTDRVGVHILSGQYDSSGTVAHGLAAHEAIAGSTFAEMSGVGHFPMSENPEAFFRYLLPILDKISSS